MKRKPTKGSNPKSGEPLKKKAKKASDNPEKPLQMDLRLSKKKKKCG